MPPVNLPGAVVGSPHNHIGNFDSPASRSPEKVASQLESVFVSMMLKSMRESMSKEMFAGEGSDTFGGLFDSLMADHITAEGGLGLADMILQSGNSSLSAASVPMAPTPLPPAPNNVTPSHQSAIKAYQNANG